MTSQEIISSESIQPNDLTTETDGITLNDAQRRLVESGIQYANSLVYEFLDRGVEFEDLFQEAYLGLVQAATRFDPDRDVKFTTFASRRVRGALADIIRKSNPLTRSDQKFAGQWKAAEDRLVAQLGHWPSVEELAVELKVDIETAGEFLVRYRHQLDGKFILSLDDVTEEELAMEDDDPRMPGFRPFVGSVAMLNIDGLKQKEKEALFLHVVAEHQISEIGARFGVDESRVTQLKVEAMKKIAAAEAELGLREVAA